MTQQDLKHAMVSLVVGILVTAAMSLLNGLIHILSSYATDVIGAGAGSVSYLVKHYTA